jgi:hypothetical protein
MRFGLLGEVSSRPILSRSRAAVRSVAPSFIPDRRRCLRSLASPATGRSPNGGGSCDCVSTQDAPATTDSILGAMCRSRSLLAALAVAGVLGAGCSSAPDGTGLQIGSALATRTGPGPFIIGLRDIHPGTLFYVLDPALVNVSGKPLTIESARVIFSSRSIADLGHRTYYTTPQVGTPIAWRAGDGAEIQPSRLSPQRLIGLTLPPHHTLPNDRFSMGRYRVGQAGGFNAGGLVVTYRQDGEHYLQVIPIDYHVRVSQ